MNIVLDTNILLTSISNKSHLYWIFQTLLEQQYTLCVTTEILDEYAEILEQKMGIGVAEAVLKAIINLPNTRKVDVVSAEDFQKILNFTI